MALKFENDAISLKSDVSVEKLPSKIQNRFADAKLALRGTTDVIRRDGLSSWREILFMAVGMLSCNSASQYLFFFGKVEFSDGRTNSFWPGPIFQLSLIS